MLRGGKKGTQPKHYVGKGDNLVIILQQHKGVRMAGALLATRSVERVLGGL
jgi:hypothetical protein